jgi:hypothetical protein
MVADLPDLSAAHPAIVSTTRDPVERPASETSEQCKIHLDRLYIVCYYTRQVRGGIRLMVASSLPLFYFSGLRI